MARLAESPALLEAIKVKAYQNAMKRSTYGQRAEFKPGKAIVSFSEHCQTIQEIRLRFL